MRLLESTGTERLDPLLMPFLRAAEPESEDALGRLLTSHARPVIRGILRRRAGGEAGDLEGEIVLHLIERLRRLRLEPGAAGIRDFRGYVAVATYNALTEQVRKREPVRAGGRGETEDDALLGLPDPAPNAAVALVERHRLALLWQEIRRLPPRQVAALLLNLRDDRGGNAVVLLPLTGIATLREIARALGLAAEAFAEMWNRLPLEDAAIAELLGITRQQVINLRKSARERLTRRMRAH